MAPCPLLEQGSQEIRLVNTTRLSSNQPDGIPMLLSKVLASGLCNAVFVALYESD